MPARASEAKVARMETSDLSRGPAGGRPFRRWGERLVDAAGSGPARVAARAAAARHRARLSARRARFGRHREHRQLLVETGAVTRRTRRPPVGGDQGLEVLLTVAADVF